MERAVVQIGKVVRSSVSENRDRKIKSRMLQVKLSSDDDIQTVEYMSSFGDDSVPPPGSDVVVVSIGSAWKVALASRALIDADVSYASGDRVIRSTDSSSSETKAVIVLKANGDIEIIPSSGTLKVNGDVDMTGIIKGPSVFNGAQSNTHVHPAGSLLDGEARPCTGSTGTPA